MHLQIKRICVPTDFSPSAEHALHYGAGLAEFHEAELHLLHVLQDFEQIVLHPDYTASGEQIRDYFDQLEQTVVGPPGEAPVEHKASEEEGVHRFLRSLELGIDKQFAEVPLDKWWERIRILRATRYGNPVREICSYARNHSIDLLILGTHGRTGLSQLLVGSVAERVVRVSPCPVLTVRHPAHDFIVED
jgi:nucleotide-binding universal stress UspA family protein